MNWYKQLKRAFRNPIDMASNILSKKILRLIMNLYKENRLFSQPRSTSSTAKYEGFEDPIKININIEVFNNYIAMPFLINAVYSSSQPSILYSLQNPKSKSIDRIMTINIKIARNFDPNFFHDFYTECAMVIRHELEHMIQDQERLPQKYPRGYNVDTLMKESDPMKLFNEVSKYMASLFEQEPFIRGFMLSCKKNGKPLLPALRQLIHNNLFSSDPAIEKAIRSQYGIQADHIEKLLTNLYVKRAKEIFPNAEDIA